MCMSTDQDKQTEVIVPEEVYASVQSALESKLQKLRYGRVFMSLSSLLEGEFFNTYIKSGISPQWYGLLQVNF